MKMVIFPTVVNQTRSQAGQSGFTLFELLIVISIAVLAIGTALSVYRPGKSSANLRVVAYNIATKMNNVRNKAIRLQDEFLIRFDISEKEITFSGSGTDIRLAQNIEINVTTAASETRSDATTGIRYFPNGRSTGGTVVLKQGEQIYEIRINWLTGRVSTHKISVQNK